jgi:hypothetical protein
MCRVERIVLRPFLVWVIMKIHFASAFTQLASVKIPT